MTTEGKVSPLRLPLCAVVDDGDGGAIIDAKGGLIAATEFMGESEQIVRAVNAHDRLVDAAEDALSMCRYLQQSPVEERPYGVDIDRVADKCRAALAAAKEG